MQISQPPLRSYSPPQPVFAPVPTQIDIARQTVSALPLLAGPVITGTEPAVATQPAPLETVSLIEPATETPLGSLADSDSDLVSDANVVPAAASDDEPGTVSILEAAPNGADSVLEEPESTDPGALLLNGPEDN